jgi:hypothetical protein
VPHADEWPCAKGETPKLPEAYKSIDGLLRKLALLPPNSVLPTEALRRRVNQAVAGFDDDYGDPRRDLFDALSQDIGPRQQAWHRLRICACGTLFVALTMRTKYCTPECSNRLRQKAFYEAHTAEERERKLREYEANRERNSRARTRRHFRDSPSAGR